MNVRRVAPDFYVADQLEPDDLHQLEALGVRSLVNNRPEGEAPEQPGGAAIEARATALDMRYRAVPVRTRAVTDAELAEFRAALEALPRPVCAYCRSGVRSVSCWALTALADLGPVPVLRALERAGFSEQDLAPNLLNGANGMALTHNDHGEKT